MLAGAAGREDAKGRRRGLIETDQAGPLVELLARGAFSARLAGETGQPLSEGD